MKTWHSISFASLSMGVLIIKSESEILAFFFLYVFYDTKPTAFNMHGLINV